jgi:hypothetical protein
VLKNPFSWGAAILGAISVLFVLWAVVVPGVAGTVLFAALACFLVAGILWIMAERLGHFVYRGGKILKKGIKADARVTAVDEADVVINANPVMQVDLQVHPKNKEPFDTTVRQMVPKAQSAAVTVGATVPVRIDISDRTRVVIDFASL